MSDLHKKNFAAIRSALTSVNEKYQELYSKVNSLNAYINQLQSEIKMLKTMITIQNTNKSSGPTKK